jgi:plasmid stabilization system protein ParE
MALKIVWTENAETHLEAILIYWSERNESSLYSQKLYKMFQKELDVLTRYPEIGAKTTNDLIRKKTVRDYFLYYNFDDEVLTVLGLVDMRRNPKFIKTFEK